MCLLDKWLFLSDVIFMFSLLQFIVLFIRLYWAMRKGHPQPNRVLNSRKRSPLFRQTTTTKHTGHLFIEINTKKCQMMIADTRNSSCMSHLTLPIQERKRSSKKIVQCTTQYIRVQCHWTWVIFFYKFSIA